MKLDNKYENYLMIQKISLFNENIYIYIKHQKNITKIPMTL